MWYASRLFLAVCMLELCMMIYMHVDDCLPVDEQQT